jgi:hypothetical protein
MKPKPPDARFWSKVNKTATCWLWMGSKTTTGYGSFGISRGRIEKAHRVSWELHFGSIPQGMMVCHHCDVPLCVRPDHLFLGTQSDNMCDSRDKGRLYKPDVRGEKHGKSKLKEIEVVEIFTNPSGESTRNLATRFGVAFATIWDIKKGRRWNHLKQYQR